MIGATGSARLATRDWKKAVEEAIETLGDRVREAMGLLDGMLGAQPEPVRVPVRPSRDHRPRR